MKQVTNSGPRPPRRQPKAEATRAKFLCKVELLESWVKAGGAPDGQDWPRGPVGLREWSDAKLGIEAWSSPNVASPKKRYADLRKRFDKAVEDLDKLSSNGGTTSLRERLKDAKALNRVLAAQILTMRCQFRKSEKDLARTKTLLRLSQERESTLTSELSKLLPLRRLEI